VGGEGAMEEGPVCLVCGEEHGFDDIHELEIKGKTRKICKGCAAAIKGII